MALITMENIRFKRDERVILDDVNFSINDGEQWVLLGKNGSGKTTLLEMMNGYLFPSSGTVTVLGNRYGECDVREVRRRIGYISQSFVEKLTLRDPVWEIVCGALHGVLRYYETIPPGAKEQAIAMLERLGVGKLSHQPLAVLSQGERKKVLLARALIAKPEIVIMDEPCAGLDLYEREKLLADLPVFLEEGIHLVYVTHHIEEIVPVFTHVLLLDQGNIVAAGSKRSVLTPASLEAAYQVPVDVEWTSGRPWLRVLS